MSYPLKSKTTKELSEDPWKPVGDIIDSGWYQHIRSITNKPDLPSIVILARILYFYRPVEDVVRNEAGTVIKKNFKQKFAADMWQVSRGSLAEQFGFTERQVDKALSKLVSMGLIYKELRKLTVNGIKLSNVLYIGLNLSELKKISAASVPSFSKGSAQKMADLSHSNDIGQPEDGNSLSHSNDTGRPEKGNTYTETSLETPLEITLKTETKNIKPPAAHFVTQDKKEVQLPWWLPLQEWNAFIEMRKNMRKPLTDYAKKLLINILCTYREKGHDLAQIINKSVINNWPDLYEPKIKIKGNEPKNITSSGNRIPANDPFYTSMRRVQVANNQSESKGVTAIQGPDDVTTGQT